MDRVYLHIMSSDIIFNRDQDDVEGFAEELFEKINRNKENILNDKLLCLEKLLVNKEQFLKIYSFELEYLEKENEQIIDSEINLSERENNCLKLHKNLKEIEKLNRKINDLDDTDVKFVNREAIKQEIKIIKDMIQCEREDNQRKKLEIILTVNKFAEKIRYILKEYKINYSMKSN